ncbi:MAG: glycosyltransferase family 2 protein [Micrococcales bacterium]|nr:glycosyltransferase family 2 protein [Micrococcales bacterium]
MAETATRDRADGTTEDLTLTVLLPCLDEAETLATVIGRARGSIEELGLDAEVLVADNGSTDGSQDIARAAGARVLDVPTRGYGAALKAGIAEARGRYVIMGDADDSYALEDLGPFVEALDAGADLVMGNRFAGGIGPGAMPPLHRWLGNPVLSFLGRLFFKIPVHDFHCGMRGMRRDRIVALGLRTDGMEFASEMVVHSALSRLRIVEVPTTLRKDGRSRPPHLRTWRDGWRHLKFLLAFSPRWLYYYPSLVLLVLGLVAMVALYPGPLTVGGVSWDVQTMVVAATATVLGVQGVGMALLARAFSAGLGLLPRSRRLDTVLSRFALENGIVAGLVLTVAGLLFFVGAVLRWSAQDFGALEHAAVRDPLVGLVLVVTGTQLVLVSFMLSLVRMQPR